MPPLRQMIAGEESVFIAPLGGLMFAGIIFKARPDGTTTFSRSEACFSLVL